MAMKDCASFDRYSAIKSPGRILDIVLSHFATPPIMKFLASSSTRQLLRLDTLSQYRIGSIDHRAFPGFCSRLWSTAFADPLVGRLNGFRGGRDLSQPRRHESKKQVRSVGLGHPERSDASGPSSSSSPSPSYDVTRCGRADPPAVLLTSWPTYHDGIPFERPFMAVESASTFGANGNDIKDAESSNQEGITQCLPCLGRVMMEGKHHQASGSEETFAFCKNVT